MNYHTGKPKLKPSSKYFAKARAAPKGGWHGQFAGPGLIPDVVSVGGKPEVFATEEEATLAAYEALEAVLNARLQLRMRFEKHQKMSAEELSEALDAADITPTELGHIVQSDRVIPWLDGVYDIPHMLRVIVGLLQFPENIERAEKITADALIEKEPRQ